MARILFSWPKSHGFPIEGRFWYSMLCILPMVLHRMLHLTILTKVIVAVTIMAKQFENNTESEGTLWQRRAPIASSGIVILSQLLLGPASSIPNRCLRTFNLSVMKFEKRRAQFGSKSICHFFLDVLTSKRHQFKLKLVPGSAFTTFHDDEMSRITFFPSFRVG